MAFTGNFTCDSFKIGLTEGQFNFSTDTFYIALYTNAASLDQTTTAYTTTGEVVAAGYTAGGEVLTPLVGTTSAYVSFDNVSWTGSFTARGALIYKSGGDAVCVLDFGADRTSTGIFTVQFPIATADQALIRIT
tara:strand:+ start:3341 stop:3742 length:402 start_codon:yes stop_codon:yes gene_type:complete